MVQAAPGTSRNSDIQTLGQAGTGSAQQALALVLDAMPALVSYVDADLRFRFANATHDRWLTRARQEVVGKHLSEVLGQENYERVAPYVERVLQGEATRFECALTSPTGSRWVRVHYTPHADESGKALGFIAVVDDISEEKRVLSEREALLSFERAALQRFALLAKAGELVTRSFDSEQALKQVLSLSLPSLGDVGWFELVERGGGRRYLTEVRPEAAVSEAELESLLNAGPLLKPKPAQVWVETDVSPERLSDLAASPQALSALRALGVSSILSVPLRDKRRAIGSLTLLFGGSGRRHTGHDLWLAEELARCAASALVHSRLLSEAQAAVHARDDFLSIAGHELRTPLTALQLQVLSIARMLKQGEYGPRVTQRAEKAAHNVLRVSKLVDELLDISRLSAGRLALERSLFDLREAVRAAVEQQREEAARANCELNVEADTAVVGTWDRARIEQVVSNLLGNAIKYGHGKPIYVTVSGDEHEAHVSVRDAGIGIDQADQERIFQRFERGDTLPRSGGLGLGLWIARELVQGHGGSIRVESAPGAGARFDVTLPRSPGGGRTEASANAHAS